jgi:hypothetical protein
VLDGDRVARDLPEVHALYLRVMAEAARLTGADLVPMTDVQVAANVNIVSIGGEYRWHYDRNAVTALVYLNAIDGGELECCPRYRIFLGHRLPRLQRGLDALLTAAWVRRLFGRVRVVRPAPGRMVVMRGDRCLHSVRPLTGSGERINLVFAYVERGAPAPVRAALDSYLYSQHDTVADPNYQRTGP